MPAGIDEQGSTKAYGRLRTRSIPRSSNPGWPLPGHVMTHPGTGPGTEVWEDFKLDGREW